MFSAWTIGFTLAVVSASCWASLDIVRKHIGQYMSASSAILGIMLCHVPILVPFLTLGEFFPSLRGDDPVTKLLFVGYPEELTAAFFMWSGGAILLNIIANFLFLRAVQLSPLSLTTPYLAFTPIFAAIIAFFAEDQIPTIWGQAGIATVCFGAFFLNPGNKEDGALAPLKALWKERGSAYMLIVAFLWGTTPILNKRAFEETSPMWQTLFLAVGVGLFFLGLKAYRDGGFETIWNELSKTPYWIVASAAFNAGALALQLGSYEYIDIAYVETVKRAVGVISAILAGYVLFKEKDIVRRLLGAALMVAGVAMVLFGG
jgi:drug/metabolite transporter (DMT)-like permease